MQKSIDKILFDFRVTDCELFNRHFRIEDPWNNQEAAWECLERFNDFEIFLFKKLVSEALGIENEQYGKPQRNILAKLNAPLSVLINREIDSGYWDHSAKELPQFSEIHFISFFDWDAISIRENRFIRAIISSCPLNPSLAGKQVLIDSPGDHLCWRIQGPRSQS